MAIVSVGIEPAKSVFAVHGVDESGTLVAIRHATLRDHAPFDEAARLNKKQNRQSFVMPARFA